MNLKFVSQIHEIACRWYNDIERHSPMTAHIVNKLISYCPDDMTGRLKKLYNNTERKNRESVFKKYLDENVKLEEDDDAIKWNEVRILLFLIEMLCLKDAQKKRRYKLNHRRKGHVV